MTQLYARVFLAILDSSIAEDHRVRHIFEDVLKLQEDGILDMTREAFARRTNVPLDEVNRAIDILEAPDLRSRDPRKDGRRLQRLDKHRDWGWRITNWEGYDQIRTAEDFRVAARDRKRRERERKRLSSHPSPVPSPTASEAEAEAEAEAGRHLLSRDICDSSVTSPPTPPVSEKEGDGSVHGKLAPWERIELTKQLKDIDDQIKFLGSDCMTDQEKAKRALLKARRKEVRTSLGWL